MPVEIRKLVIQAAVEEPQGGVGQGGASGPAQTGASAEKMAGAPKPGSGARDRAAMVAECVEQVMEILGEQKER